MGKPVELNHIYRRKEGSGISGERYRPLAPTDPSIEVLEGVVDIYISNCPPREFLNPILGFKDKHPIPPFDDPDILTEMTLTDEGLGKGIHCICCRSCWIAIVPNPTSAVTPVVCEADLIDHQFDFERFKC